MSTPTTSESPETKITYEMFIVSFFYVIEIVNELLKERNDFVFNLFLEFSSIIVKSLVKLHPRLYEIIFHQPIEHIIAEEYNLKSEEEDNLELDNITSKGIKDKEAEERLIKFLLEEAGSSASERKSVLTSDQVKRRESIARKPDPTSLFSILKNSVGKDVTGIAMPINFNEPLSMLQRLAESHEYSYLLDTAANCSDCCEQLAYIAAFIISGFSTTVDRTTKPFNPLLGETYEYDRRNDLGWFYFAEQVSHHPPISAVHCEGKKWKYSEDCIMTSKFRGKYLQIDPSGYSVLEFGESKNCFKWQGVTTVVHNIVIGKIWIDHYGDMEITGLKNAEGNSCQLTFVPYSYFDQQNQRHVKGTVSNNHNEVKWIINGSWDKRVDITPVLSTITSKNNIQYKTGNLRTIWIRELPPPENEKFYNFSKFASELNQIETKIPPTDSRLRPDQRLMELGRWDESNAEKIRLEEKQRAKKKLRRASRASGIIVPTPAPLWFTQVEKPKYCETIYQFNGSYWNKKKLQDWSACPDIF